MLLSNLARRNIACLMLGLLFGLIGYGIATIQAKRNAAIEQVASATVDLWYFRDVLASLQIEDPRPAHWAIAMKADEAVASIADEQERSLSNELREFRAKALKSYRAFREAHPDLYVPPSEIAQDTKDELLRRGRRVAEFLKEATY